MLKAAFGIMLSVAFLSCGAWADTITLRADDWCPYNCEPESDEPGFMIEAAIEILGEAGHEVEYRLMDWDAAIEATRKGEYNAIVGAMKDDAPDFVFPDTPAGIAPNAFFVPVGSNWRFTGMDALKGKKLLGITSYAYGEEVDTLFEDSGIYKDSLESAVESLLKGEGDVLVENLYVMNLFMLNNYLSDQIVSAGVHQGSKEDSEVYIAFSPANPKSAEYAKILGEGLRRMKADGRWQKLMDKYGIK